MSERDYEIIEESSDPNLLYVKKSFLESRGIQCDILGENFNRAEGIKAGGIIRTRLIVRGDQAEQAQKLLAEFE